jgi:hypothetical protein
VDQGERRGEPDVPARVRRRAEMIDGSPEEVASRFVGLFRELGVL